MRLATAAALVLFCCACSSSSKGSGNGDVTTPPPSPPPTAPPQLPQGGGDWLQYRHDARGASENPAQFAAADVRALRVHWTAELGQYVYTQALIASDLVVATTAYSGKVVAFDTTTGGQRWSRDLNAPVSTNCKGDKKVGFWGSAAIDGNVVYAASPDGKLYALSRADGSTLWSATVADGSAAGHGEFVQSSPAVSATLGKLYLGVASSEHCDLIAGRVLSVDLATHAVTRRELVPAGQRGGGVWSSVTVAEDEGRVYVTSGNQLGGRLQEPLAQAFLALDARTLDVLDHWQNPTALENSDFGSSPVIFDAGGMKLVAAANKDGNLYVLRRDALAAGPVWTARLATLDPSDLTHGADPTLGYGSIVTPAFAGGRLFAAGGKTPAGEPGAVTAFDPATGTVLWSTALSGYVIAPPAVAGSIVIVESSTPDYSTSWLSFLDTATGAVLRTERAPIATFGAPSIGRGLVAWTDSDGHLQLFGP